MPPHDSDDFYNKHEYDEYLQEESHSKRQAEDPEEQESVTCLSIIHQNVCIEALVKIKPLVKLGDGFIVKCGPVNIDKIDKIEKPKHLPHHRPALKREPRHEPKKEELRPPKHHHQHKEDECRYVISQEVCLQIPLLFSVEAIAKPGGVICHEPEPGPCPCDHEENPCCKESSDSTDET